MDAVSSKRILIVEDENDVVDLLTLNLRKAGGFLISKAGDGATGLTKARAEKPDLIILDLMLPKIPGLEVCKILKSEAATRHIPDRKSTRLNSSHSQISYAVFCLKKK